jgi:hypothetical protein
LKQKNTSLKIRLEGNLSDVDNLKKIIDEKNRNPNILNRHFIEDLLASEKNVNKNKNIYIHNKNEQQGQKQDGIDYRIRCPCHGAPGSLRLIR